MQINFRLLPVLTLAVFTTFTACKKDAKPSTDSTTEMATHADDQNQVSGQIDGVANDASIAIESSAAYTGRLQGVVPISCDATATFDSTSNPRKITITYSGTNCNGNFKRTGSVVVTMDAGVQWKNAGAAITVAYQNLKVTRLSDNKSVTINGSHTITNVGGGLLYSLLFGQVQSITHDVNGSLTISFDDNTQRSWQVATRRVFTFSNNSLVLTISGNHTDGNAQGIAEWGTNRFGHSFVTTITESLIIRSDCSLRLTAGQVTHTGFGTATATFGLDASGNPTTCPSAGGHYYYKLTWAGPNGASASAILPY